MCKKKFDESQKIARNLSFSSNSQSATIFTISVGQFVPQPPSHQWLWKMVSPDSMHCHVVHRRARKPSSPLALSEPSNQHLKFPKMIREASADFWRQKAPRESFLHLQTAMTQCCSYFHTFFFTLLHSFLHRHPPLAVKGSVSRDFLGPFLACMDRSLSI
jgi:hypothetical protein